MNASKEQLAEVIKSFGKEDEVDLERTHDLFPYMMLDFQAHQPAEAAPTPAEAARWKTFSDCLRQLVDEEVRPRIQQRELAEQAIRTSKCGTT